MVHLLTRRTVTDLQRASAWPAVSEKAVGIVAFVHLVVNGRHLLREVSAEHARLEEPWALALPSDGPISVSLKPLWMCVQCLLVCIIWIHSGDNPKAALPSCNGQVAKQVTSAQELTSMLVRDLRRIKGDNPASIYEDGIHFKRSPIVHPGIGVQGERVTLVQVKLAAPAHGGIPGLTRRRSLRRRIPRLGNYYRSC